MMTKDELRAVYKEFWKSDRDRDLFHQVNQGFCDQLEILFNQFKPRTIAAYIPMRDEPNWTSHKWWAIDEVNWFFPMLDDAKVQKMNFYQAFSSEVPHFLHNKNLQWPGKKLERFSLAAHLARETNSDKITFFLVPGMGYSSITGQRLGRGKGFYDRYFDRFLRKRPHEVRKNIKLIGLTLDRSLGDWDVFEPHDCKMDYVITESQILVIKNHL